MSTVLFISKDIFDYRGKIIDCLSKDLNFKVNSYSIRPETFIYGIYRKLFPFYAKRIQKKHHEKILRSTKHLKFDYVFFTQIHHLPLSILQLYKEQFQSSKFLLYYWDSLSKHDYSDYIDHFNVVFTFDSNDAVQNPKLKYLPLFFTKEYGAIRYQRNNQTKYDILFVGSITNLKRYYQLKLFIKWANANHIRFYYHAFISPLDYIKLTFREKSFPRLSLFYLKPYQVQNLFSISKVILDLSNNIQTGLTLRTIEAIGAGKKLITMNELIRKEIFYDEERIFIANNTFPQKSFFIDHEPKAYDCIESYSLENWLRTIFGI